MPSSTTRGSICDRIRTRGGYAFAMFEAGPGTSAHALAKNDTRVRMTAHNQKQDL